MKKITLATLCFLLLFVSCKKNNSDDNYHVSFTVNGVGKTYTGHVLAHTEVNSGFTTLIILGANSATSFNDNMGIYIDNYPGGATISAGAFQDNATNYTLLSTYTNNAIDYEAGQSVAEDGVLYNVPIASHFKVNITSMDSHTARGTFSGEYYKDGDVHTTPLSITNGDFYVKFQ